MKYAKSLALAATVFASGAAFSAVVPEGSYPQQADVPAAQTVTRSAVAAEAARWNLAGRPGLVKGEGRPTFQTFGLAPASRAEVAADRDHWNRAGLADATRGATPDFNGRDFQVRLNRYEQLQDSNGTSAE